VMVGVGPGREQVIWTEAAAGVAIGPPTDHATSAS